MADLLLFCINYLIKLICKLPQMNWIRPGAVFITFLIRLIGKQTQMSCGRPFADLHLYYDGVRHYLNGKRTAAPTILEGE